MRVAGVEPARQEWRSCMQPLHHTSTSGARGQSRTAVPGFVALCLFHWTTRAQIFGADDGNRTRTSRLGTSRAATTLRQRWRPRLESNQRDEVLETSPVPRPRGLVVGVAWRFELRSSGSQPDILPVERPPPKLVWGRRRDSNAHIARYKLAVLPLELHRLTLFSCQRTGAAGETRTPVCSLPKS